MKIQELMKFKLNDIYTETNYYKKIILNNSDNFDLISLKLNILKKITFDEIIETFTKFFKIQESYVIYEVK